MVGADLDCPFFVLLYLAGRARPGLNYFCVERENEAPTSEALHTFKRDQCEQCCEEVLSVLDLLHLSQVGSKPILSNATPGRELLYVCCNVKPTGNQGRFPRVLMGLTCFA